jgi:lysophospholipase L1-like esterase
MLLRASLVVLGLASAVLRADAVSVAASDPRIRYEGRVDFSERSAPVLAWSGTRLRLDFEGAKLTLLFASATGQNFFDATIDDRTQIVSVPASAKPLHIDVPLVATGGRRHRLVLFKRSEAAAGEVRFAGVELAANARAWAPADPRYRCRMEFFGDSITAGACDEDGATDQWDDRRTHNNAKSYAALTAAAFEADYRCLAVSGMGIVTGWTDVKAGQIWDRLHPRADSPRADLRAWQPDVAFVNLGENDASFPDAHGQPFPAAGFTEGYVALAKALRAAYPHAQLVLLRGGMFNGAQNPELRRAWDAAVARLEAGDVWIHHFVFSHWSRLHPRVADHRAMADELIAWLRAQPFAASLGRGD